MNLSVKVALDEPGPRGPDNLGALLLTYSLENTANWDAAAFNRFFLLKLDRLPRYRPEYSFIQLEGQVAHVAKVPFGWGARDHFVQPHVTRLRAGGSLHETMRIALPIRACNPAAVAAGGNALTRRVDVLVVRFSIGVCPFSALKLDPTTRVWRGETVWLPSAGQSLSLTVVESKPIPLPRSLPGLDYASVPWDASLIPLHEAPAIEPTGDGR
jgi:hypothetical protein